MFAVVLAYFWQPGHGSALPVFSDSDRPVQLDGADQADGTVSLRGGGVANPARKTETKPVRAWLTARLVDSEREPLRGLVVVGHALHAKPDVFPATLPAPQLGTSTSDARGVVKLPMAIDGSLQLRLTDQDYAFVDVRPRFAYSGRDIAAGELECRRTLEVTGRVVDEEGIAIARAHVRVRCSGIEFDTKSGPDGTFHLQRLPSRASVLFADAPGYKPTSIPGPEPAVAAIVRLERAVTRSVLVVDDRGRSVESATITTTSPSQQTKIARRVAGSVGRFLVDTDGQRDTAIEITAPRHEGLTVAVPPGVEELTVMLNRCARVAGILVTPDGDPIPQRVVTCQSLRAEYTGRGHTTRLAEARSRVSTDAEGRFAFACVPPGKTLFLVDGFVVQARAREGAMTVQYRAEPAARVTDLQLVSRSMRRVVVRTRDVDGGPVAGAEVSIGGAVVRTDELGEARVLTPASTRAASERSEPRAFRIRVDAAGYGHYDAWHSENEAIREGDAYVVDLERAASVELRASGRDGKALRSRRINGFREGSATTDVSGATVVFETDSLGRAYSRRLRPGSWRFRLALPSRGLAMSPFSPEESTGLASSEVEVTLVSGRTTRVLIRDRKGISVRVGFRWRGRLQTHAWVTLGADRGGQRERKTTSETGYAGFPRRSAGDYTVSFRSRELPFEWHRRLRVAGSPSTQTKVLEVDGARLVLAVSGKRPSGASLFLVRGTEVLRLDLTESQRFVLEPLPPGTYELSSKECEIATLDASSTSFLVDGVEQIEKSVVLR